MSEECEACGLPLHECGHCSDCDATDEHECGEVSELKQALAAERDKVEKLRRELERQLSREAMGLGFDPWSARRALKEAGR